MRRLLLPLAIALVPAGLPAAAAAPRPAPSPIAAAPAAFTLEGSHARQQITVVQELPGGLSADRTGAARFTSLAPGVAAVSAAGIVSPVADGLARIRVRLAGAVRDVSVRVRNARAERLSFTRDILPLLSHAGCNSGTCHGKAEGQRGFKLSLFGYDPEADHHALTRASGGRRIAPAEPARSLLLLKAGGHVPHAGGLRLPPGSHAYRVIARWIASGAAYRQPGEPELTALSVHPRERASGARSHQQLLVTARYSDGSTRDVTRSVKYASNNELIAAVDSVGRVETREKPGEAAIMASYEGQVAVSRILVPRAPEAAPLAAPPEQNFVDRLVWSRLAKLRIRPSGLSSDGEFLRRVHLDLIGTLPTPEEARAFLADCDRERAASGGSGAARARLVDRLLDRPEYADFWALKWADLLRVHRGKLGAKGAYSYYGWIRAALADNLPYDRFVQELITAAGSSSEAGAVNFYRVVSKPEEITNAVSQIFLGVRIECAQCHHHPFEKWSQEDYYGLAGYFTRLRTKALGPSAVLLTPGGNGEAVHPRTGRPVPPRPLLAPAADLSGVEDRRASLAEWMVRPDNPFVPAAIANRLWAHFLGRGVVEPVDDFRDTNPPSNPELLQALARHLVENRYDLKALIRAITGSRVYQLSAESNPTNAGDLQNFSRAYPKRLQAEVLMDAIAGAAGSSPHLPGLPRGTRAIQTWDSELSLQWQSYFLNVFGRPPRTSPCECERSQEPSVTQALHLMNAPEIQRQISDREGRARRLALGDAEPGRIVEELFLAAYSRRPSPEEEKAALETFARAGSDRVRAAEDLLWALLNSVEFVFNH